MNEISKILIPILLVFALLVGLGAVSAADNNDLLNMDEQISDDAISADETSILENEDSVNLNAETNDANIDEVNAEVDESDKLGISQEEEDTVLAATDDPVLELADDNSKLGYEYGEFYEISTTAPNKVYYGSNAVIEVSLRDYYGYTVYGYVDIYDGNKYLGYAYVDSSTTKINIGKLSKGYHYIYVTIDGIETKNHINVVTPKLVVKAPKVTAYHKAKKYFKVTVKKGKAVKGLKIKLRVYTGKKYKTYTIKTNSKGVAKFNTKKLKVGTHKIVIISKKKGYKFKKTSKIKIKAKKRARIVVINPKAYNKYYTKRKGSYKFEVYTWKSPSGLHELDVFVYKNGKMLSKSKYLSKYRVYADGYSYSFPYRHGGVNSVYHKYQLFANYANYGKVYIKY